MPSTGRELLTVFRNARAGHGPAGWRCRRWPRPWSRPRGCPLPTIVASVWDRAPRERESRPDRPSRHGTHAGVRSAADRGRSPAASSSSSRGNGPAAADWRVARRGIAATGRGAATARDRCRRRTAARRLYAACLRALYRSSRSGFRDDRTGLVARRLHHRRVWCRRSNGDSAFRPPDFCRRACRLSWPPGRPVTGGLGRRLAWRMGRPRLAWRRLFRLARRWGVARGPDGRRLRWRPRPMALRR